MERTLSIVKPDGVKKNVIGEVIKRFEENGLRPVAMNFCRGVAHVANITGNLLGSMFGSRKNKLWRSRRQVLESMDGANQAAHEQSLISRAEAAEAEVKRVKAQAEADRLRLELGMLSKQSQAIMGERKIPIQTT